MSIKLEEDLKAHGCRMYEDDFRDLIADVFAEMYRDWTDEQLMRDPIEAIAFCGAIRYRAKCRALPYSLILGTLQNLRKSSRLVESIT